MSRFRFRLATLRKLRESLRQERQSQLGEALRAEELLLAQRQSLEAELGQLAGVYRGLGKAGIVEVDRLLDAQRYELILRAQCGMVEQQRRELELEIERRRQAVVEAAREVQILDKLEERQREAHQRAEALAEVKSLDEIGARRGLPREDAS